jgi:CSLREA domain-containing protein
MKIRNWLKCAVRGAVLLAGLAWGERAAHATLISVTTTADENGSGAACSLREAIKAANNNAPFGGCPAGSSAVRDEIQMNGYPLVFTLNGSSERLTISSNIWLRMGYNTIKGTSSSGGIYVPVGGDLSLEVAKITGFVNSIPIDVRGTARIVQSEIYGNVTFLGQQTMGINQYGGYLEVTDSYLHDNSAIKGGGIYQQGGTAVLRNVTMAANISSQYGGGYMVVGGGWGSLTNCTFSGNRATGYSGGGLYVGGDSGVAIYSSTIASNQANSTGGGIHGEPGAYIYMRSSIVDGNSAGINPGCSIAVLSGGGNLRGYNSCPLSPAYVPADNPDVAIASANLGPLTLVYTHSPAVRIPNYGSPAINRLKPAYCPASDELGRLRGSLCDIGAMERP